MLVERHDVVNRNASLLALAGRSDLDMADSLENLKSALSDPRPTDPAARRAQITAAVLAVGGD